MAVIQHHHGSCWINELHEVCRTTSTHPFVYQDLSLHSPNSHTMAEDDITFHTQFETFRDCLSDVLVERMTKPSRNSKTKRRRTKKDSQPQTLPNSVPQHDNDEDGTAAEDLAEFIDYIANQAFESLPEDLRSLSRPAWAASPDLQSRYALPLTSSDTSVLILPTLDPAIASSLTAYGIIDNDDADAVPALLAPVLTAYVTTITTTPPPPRQGRAQAEEEGCELCGRDWVPLTYHHLIPRFVHDKALKRGWHPAEALQNVAWLCRLCHSFVHRFASHEELARYYFTVDRLLAEEEVVRFARYASRVRWKGR
ncbi:hypothetical protein SODALDRAFT_326909 [Sodiomyces alkalinus F11]|uniref:HNH domain-containing protein n=1 Tax=Sodiomyces alkalinus (strain CBS 110278 / VKM F-3762 / F11) TaxID=1314773 RepID=A0A3N2Q7L1_SODAK|nr:hypothetical protein SODALDRAFT_326909 [Sodiomyces alkalinus F11]ROT42750.1 hypothetical protein SODALDRAFT_326909 [Sodiomyces alkalinus F11]